MPYREVFECDMCGRELECAFYFRRSEERPWLYTANGESPDEGNEMECSSCHRRMIDLKGGKGVGG